MSILDRVREKYQTPSAGTCKTSKSPPSDPSAGFAGSSPTRFAFSGGSEGTGKPPSKLERRQAILAARDAADLESWRAALRAGRLHLCANCTRFTFGNDPAGMGHCDRYGAETHPFVTMLRCAGFQAHGQDTAPAPDYLPHVEEPWITKTR